MWNRVSLLACPLDDKSSNFCQSDFYLDPLRFDSHLSRGWGHFECAAFGSVLAATDPVAVVGLLKASDCAAWLCLCHLGSRLLPSRCWSGDGSKQSPYNANCGRVPSECRFAQICHGLVLHRFKSRVIKSLTFIQLQLRTVWRLLCGWSSTT